MTSGQVQQDAGQRGAERMRGFCVAAGRHCAGVGADWPASLCGTRRGAVADGGARERSLPEDSGLGANGERSELPTTTGKRRFAGGFCGALAVHSHTDLAEYASYLEKNRPESHALYENLLITVTSFFRDPAVFGALQREVFPALMQKKPDTIRIWSAGCSTGQETYSLAIALLEFLEDKPHRPTVQIFGTDIADGRSIEKARVGLYLEAIEREVSPEQLRRFQETRRVTGCASPCAKQCVFAKQNVMADPPFSRLDLICCRNVLIYLTPVAQRRVIETFHYALSPGGLHLVLGGIGDGRRTCRPVPGWWTRNRRFIPAKPRQRCRICMRRLSRRQARRTTRPSATTGCAGAGARISSGKLTACRI